MPASCWMQVLSWKPRAYYFPNFATAEQCEHIIDVAKVNLKPSSLALRKGETVESTKGTRTRCPYMSSFLFYYQFSYWFWVEWLLEVNGYINWFKFTSRPATIVPLVSVNGLNWYMLITFFLVLHVKLVLLIYTFLGKSSGTFISASEDETGTLDFIEKKIAKATSIPQSHGEVHFLFLMKLIKSHVIRWLNLYDLIGESLSK